MPIDKGIVEVEYWNGEQNRGKVSEFCWSDQMRKPERIVKWKKV